MKFPAINVKMIDNSTRLGCLMVLLCKDLISVKIHLPAKFNIDRLNRSEDIDCVANTATAEKHCAGVALKNDLVENMVESQFSTSETWQKVNV